MNAALILSGGVGARFGADKPKQYVLLNGKPVIEYVLNAAETAKRVDAVLIAGQACEELTTLSQTHRFLSVPGGEKRNQTLKNGLDALSRMNCRNVVILDAVRPLVTGALLDRYMELLEEGWDAVSTVHAIDDSLGCLDMHTVDRSRYYLMQSPEAYRFAPLFAAFDPESPLTEVAQQLDPSAKLYLYRDFPFNPKLTYPHDLKYIEMALEEQGK